MSDNTDFPPHQTPSAEAESQTSAGLPCHSEVHASLGVTLASKNLDSDLGAPDVSPASHPPSLPKTPCYTTPAHSHITQRTPPSRQSSLLELCATTSQEFTQSSIAHGPHEDEQNFSRTAPQNSTSGASVRGSQITSRTEAEHAFASPPFSTHTFMSNGPTPPLRDGTLGVKRSQSMSDMTSTTLQQSSDGCSAPESSTIKRHWKSFRRSFLSLRRRRIPWCPGWVLWCLLAIFIALSLGMPLGFMLRIRDFSPPSGDVTTDSMVQLGTTLAQVDPTQRTMTFYWFVLAASCTRNPCEDYDILFDQNILGNNTGTNNIPSSPAFSVNGTIFNLTADNPLYKYGGMPVFKTELTAIYGNTIDGTLKNYPFDHYRAELFIFSKIKGDGFRMEDVVPISVKSVDGIAAGYTLSVNQDTVNNGSACASLIIDIARGVEVRLYGVAIITVIWLITSVLVSTTVCAVFLKRKMAKEVMVLPVATLFAFTQLRQSLPGAPPDSGEFTFLSA